MGLKRRPLESGSTATLANPIDWERLLHLDDEQAREFLSHYKVNFESPHEQKGVIVDIEVMVYGGAIMLPSGVYDGLIVPNRRGQIYVDGDLRVKGVLEQPFQSCALFVAGDLIADHVVTTSELVVAGNATIAGIFYGNCTNYDTVVYGDFAADSIILEKNHHFAVYGTAQHESVQLEDEVHGYEATAEWMSERGLEDHDERGLARQLRSTAT